MPIEAYRVRKQFQWRGWIFAPRQEADCEVEGAERMAGSGCRKCGDLARCDAGIKPEQYAGDIWLVEAGHPRKDIMLAHRFAIGDSSISPVDELLKDPQYQRLLAPCEVRLEAARPAAPPKREREKAGIIRV